MRNALACVGAVALLALVGAGEAIKVDGGLVQARAPGWIPVPASAEVAQFSGLGRDTGTLDLRFDGPVSNGLAAVKTRLALQGFALTETAGSVDHFMGADSITIAVQGASGRRLQIASFDTPTGGLLRMSYIDPPSQVAALGD